MKKPLTAIFLVVSASAANANGLSINCGPSEGYSYYFESGLVSRANSGFTDDGISNGKFSLTINENGDSDILAIDATGNLKSVTSQGGQVMTLPANGNGGNWIGIYSDGTLEVYSWNSASNKVAVYRNTVGNPTIAKNSLFISDCE